MLIPFREITRDALRRRYAVGAFNCLSVENVMGAVAAAEELHSPIILQLAEVQFPEAPMELMAPVFLRAARDAKVPVAVHLDHGRSIETCIRAVREGFTSVMFDGAELPFEENAEQTRLVVRLAHAAGVDVEAELGRVGDTGFGGEGTAAAAADVFTDVEESARFIARTGTDALAIAIGNLHGRYTATPRLNIARLREIHARNAVPLVLHGGSGTSEEDFKACIRNGICKINVATAIQIAAAEAVAEYLARGGSPGYIGIKRRIIEASQRAVAEHIRLFESDGKA
ncbi:MULTISPECIES: class II fructose-bisphosphate aldolase [Alistipes]|mgnify:FL=1|jgi:fructose-bisphosphate aldolase, class II|uniref:class II fructose-bisphosphate aldolase n=1 Tax=Alistipes TaxID=239759 RepID=UPI001B3A3971|nr:MULTISPECIES: class II fructose-bisphosphate aldolase [Alistipes]MBQ4904222.1 class II fructose-bisphosphate aldolase [Alistipes sp. Marseille-P2263]MBS5643339.1 class II fructose-bisphosphate aldolase [Alistipes sp.]MCI2258176.1 class II fructose-bisphosphate aldolase [Alistipes dispar]HJC18559.1 class II fructose-bisphosphate aldolase [Candidatus Alistipes stercoripullorum]